MMDAQTNTEAIDAKTTAAASVDANEVRSHVEMLHGCASGIDGVLVVAAFGENPETGRRLPSKVQHFRVGEVEPMCTAISQMAKERHRNVYVPLSVFKKDLLPKAKGGERDVIAVLGLVADFDDSDAVNWQTRMPLAPDLVLETSEARFQAFIIFEKPISPDEAKNLAEGLQAFSNCDYGTKDISHVWRIPGTPNWPNAKKIEAGRPPHPQSVRVELPWRSTFTNSRQFGEILDRDHTENSSGPDDTDFSESDSDEDSDDDSDDIILSADADPPSGKFEALLCNDEIFRLTWNRKRKDINDKSASGYDMCIANICVAAGWSDQEVANTMIAHRRLHDSDLEIDRLDKYKKTIGKARIAQNGGSHYSRNVEDVINQLNEEFAVVLAGGRATVIHETMSKNGQKVIQFLNPGAFRIWLANHPPIPQGSNRFVTAANYWLRHPNRREYSGICFEPSGGLPECYNLWQGFPVIPKPGKCSLFLDHLLWNVCRGDEDLYNWILAWLAALFQYPGTKFGTSLVLRGKQGVGKSIVAEIIGSLLGEHYKIISDPRYITGQFNSHLAYCLLLHVDEGFWAGDRRAEGKLKDLVTGHNHQIEYKGKEPFTMRNHVRLIITGNADWIVPAGMEERRFAVLDVGDSRRGDHTYFRNIVAEMDNGGREALLDHLLNLDLADTNLRSIPRTAALLEQKFHSMTTEQQFWLDTLADGRLPGSSRRSPNEVKSDDIYEEYLKHVKESGNKYPASKQRFGRFLHRSVPGLEGRRFGKRENRYSGYCFPALSRCRQAFERDIQFGIDWEDQEMDWMR